MKIDYDTLRDMIQTMRLIAEEDELTALDVLDSLEAELDAYEYENF